jgi:hypothetical protein
MVHNRSLLELFWHRFNDCPKPRCEQAIEQRKKEMSENKKYKKQKGKGKGQADTKSSEGGAKPKNFMFAPPTQVEKNRRVRQKALALERQEETMHKAQVGQTTPVTYNGNNSRTKCCAI